MVKEKIVLVYLGGLDIFVVIQWLVELGYEVIVCCLDVGEGKNLDFIKEKVIIVGVSEFYMIDVKEEFVEDFVLIVF